jgi:tetratricopeptide (TPR) repeat protein
MVPADPGATRAWLNQGLASHREGDLPSALAAYQQALALSPGDADALNLLGSALLQTGRATEAEGPLEQAARKQRNNALVLANLGQCYIALGRSARACETFRKAARIAPQQAEIQLGLGVALALDSRLSEAESLLRRLTSRFPQVAAIWLNYGNVLRDQKRPEAAAAAYEKALQLDQHLLDARNNLGSVLHSMLRFDEAEAQYRRCILQAPDYLLARFNLTSVLIDVGRFAEAEAAGREIIARAPEAPQAQAIVGAAQAHQGRLIDALQSNARAAALAPQDLKTLQTYAATLLEAGHQAEGLRCFQQALALDPDAPATHQLLGTALLAHGGLQDGWAEYRWRPTALRFHEKYPHLALAQPLPEEVARKHLYVLREQGLGDELFFLRYAPLLASRGARITYQSGEKLASLLARVESLSKVVVESDAAPAADANIMVGDLPLALGTRPSSALRLRTNARSTLIDFAHHIAVFWPPVPPSLRIAPRAELMTALRERLARYGPPPYIGVTWRAGTLPEEQSAGGWVLYKSIGIPALAATMHNVAGTLLALQRKPAAGELQAMSAALGRELHDMSEVNDDLEAMLALLALIDDYVGVSNTNMHLRAAVGRTARVLVPAPAEWRWLAHGRSSPWFPGFSIYRQSLQGDWSAALGALQRDLEANYGRSVRSNPP